MPDKEASKLKSQRSLSTLPISDNFSFFSSCLQYLSIQQLLEPQDSIHDLTQEASINKKIHSPYLSKKSTVDTPKTIKKNKKSMRDGRAETDMKLACQKITLNFKKNLFLKNQGIKKEKERKQKSSKIMRVKSLEFKHVSQQKNLNDEISSEKIQSSIFYTPYKTPYTPQAAHRPQTVSNFANEPYTPKNINSLKPAYTYNFSKSKIPNISQQQNKPILSNKSFYPKPIYSPQPNLHMVYHHKAYELNQNLNNVYPTKQNLLKIDQRDHQYSNQKTQRKHSIDEDNNFIYKDLKKLELNQGQKYINESDNIDEIIKSKIKVLDLSSTKKQGFNQSGKLSINENGNKNTGEMQNKIISQNRQAQDNKIENLSNMQLELLKKSSISNGQFTIPMMHNLLPEQNIVQSKYNNHFLNPQYSDRYLEARRFGGSSVSGNLNPISSRKNFGNLGGLSSMTVNSYMQSVRQSKIVQKVEQSVVMMDFFNPPPTYYNISH